MRPIVLLCCLILVVWCAPPGASGQSGPDALQAAIRRSDLIRTFLAQHLGAPAPPTP